MNLVVLTRLFLEQLSSAPSCWRYRSVAKKMKSTKITYEARRYAVRELGRRAGVVPGFLKQWRIEASERETVVYPTTENRKRIVFPNTTRTFHNGDFSTIRASWMSEVPSSLRDQIPDFIIPFCSKDTVNTGRPLFMPHGSDEVRCSTDLLASVLYSLCRVEELARHSRDSHDRFPAAESIAAKEGFLDRPIVDEYGLALAEALHHLLPNWTPQPRQLRVKVTHDIDLTGMPFSLRSAVGHLLKRRKPLAAARDLFERRGKSRASISARCSRSRGACSFARSAVSDLLESFCADRL